MVETWMQWGYQSIRREANHNAPEAPPSIKKLRLWGLQKDAEVNCCYKTVVFMFLLYILFLLVYYSLFYNIIFF